MMSMDRDTFDAIEGLGQGSARPRLNLLLTYGGWRDMPAVLQLPRLLTPMGIRAMQAESGDEAAQIIDREPVHIAVVDLEIPLSPKTGMNTRARTGGPRLLQLLKRLETPPPTIVVKPRQGSAREHARSLSQSLREGAFAVLDRPLELESLLEVLRRVLRRHYRDGWPQPGPSMR
ncbi:MAG: hypothetical protein VX527_03720 [Planctomycetota bacterium]|nr:hypothetical protein [Planctomycetota bacterium]